LRIKAIDLSLLISTEIKAVCTFERNVLVLEFIKIVKCYITGIANNPRIKNIELHLCGGRIEDR
jgi:hypothetical protein